MSDYKILTYEKGGICRAGLAVGDDIIDCARAGIIDSADDADTSTLSLFEHWGTIEKELSGVADNPPSDAIAGSLSDITLRAPILYPGTVFCTGANYADHIKEMGGKMPDKSKTKPYVFLKSARHTVIGNGEDIRLPSSSEKIDWEAELGVVIGRRCRNVSAPDALDYIAGYTIVHDVSARDLGKRPDWPQFQSDWMRHKNFDTSCPIGPWIVPADAIEDPHDLSIKLSVNGKTEQDSNTSEMIFDAFEQVEFLSSYLTLLPGDVIATGTPAGVGAGKGRFLKSGDTVTIEIEGIGVLENPVVDGE